MSGQKIQGLKADMIICDDLSDIETRLVGVDLAGKHDDYVDAVFYQTQGRVHRAGSVTGRMTNAMPVFQQMSSQVSKAMVDHYRKMFGYMTGYGKSMWPAMLDGYKHSSRKLFHKKRLWKTTHTPMLVMHTDGRVVFSCKSYKMKMKDGTVPGKYEDAVLLLSASEDEGRAYVAGVGSMRQLSDRRVYRFGF